MTDQWTMLGLAIKIVTNEFHGKLDRGGKPYILHCLHVMNNVDQEDPELMQIAVLHDLAEDFPLIWPLSRLTEMGFSKRVTDALQLLTHTKGVDYLEVYITGIMTNWDAVRVKRQDLKHNGCVTRSKGLREKDQQRLVKYIMAFQMLSECKQ